LASTWRHGLTAEAGADWQLMFALLLAGLSRLGCLFRDEVLTGPLMRCHVQRLVDFRLGAEQGCSSFDAARERSPHTSPRAYDNQPRSTTIPVIDVSCREEGLGPDVELQLAMSFPRWICRGRENIFPLDEGMRNLEPHDRQGKPS